MVRNSSLGKTLSMNRTFQLQTGTSVRSVLRTQTTFSLRLKKEPLTTLPAWLLLLAKVLSLRTTGQFFPLSKKVNTKGFGAIFGEFRSTMLHCCSALNIPVPALTDNFHLEHFCWFASWIPCNAFVASSIRYTRFQNVKSPLVIRKNNVSIRFRYWTFFQMPCYLNCFFMNFSPNKTQMQRCRMLFLRTKHSLFIYIHDFINELASPCLTALSFLLFDSPGMVLRLVEAA